MRVEARVREAFQAQFDHAPVHIARAPGRVNLLGEHVDYNGGFVLPAAIDRATYVAFGPAGEADMSIWAADFGQRADFSGSTLQRKKARDGSPLAGWARYPAGVAWALMEHGEKVTGLPVTLSKTQASGPGNSSTSGGGSESTNNISSSWTQPRWVR